MLDRICLTLGANKCPVTHLPNPRIVKTDVKFKRPEKQWDDGEFYVQYVRNGDNITWNTDMDCEYFFNQSKINRQPSMVNLIDNGSELLDVYRSSSTDPTCFAKYAMSEYVHKDVFMWMVEMCKSERAIFDQFIQFYLNDTHADFGGLTGSKAFYVMQLDKLRDAVGGNEDLVKVISEAAGVNNCVAAVRYAKRLPDAKKMRVLNRLLTRSEIPKLPINLNDRELSGFMRAVRLVLKSQI